MVSLAIVIIPVLIAVIIIVAVGLIYKKRLDKAVNGEGNVHQTSVSPTEILPWILVLILLIWSAASLTTTKRLATEISSLENQLRNQSAILEQEIYNIQKSLDDQTASVSTVLLGLQKETRSALVHVTVTPRAYGEDTTVTLTHGAETVELEKNGPTFEKDVSLGLFERGEVYITITTNGISEVKVVDDMTTGMLWMDFLPQADVMENNLNLSYDSKGQPKELTGAINYTFIPVKDGVDATKAYLLIEQNGTLIKTIDLELTEFLSDRIEVKEPLPLETDEGLQVSIVVENSMGLKVGRVIWYIATLDPIDDGPGLFILDENNNMVFAD